MQCMLALWHYFEDLQQILYNIYFLVWPLFSTETTFRMQALSTALKLYPIVSMPGQIRFRGFSDNPCMHCPVCTYQSWIWPVLSSINFFQRLIQIRGLSGSTLCFHKLSKVMLSLYWLKYMYAPLVIEIQLCSSCVTVRRRLGFKILVIIINVSIFKLQTIRTVSSPFASQHMPLAYYMTVHFFPYQELGHVYDR